MLKVLLCDREGTLLVDPIGDRVDSPSKVKILPHVIKGLKLLSKNGFSIVIITNQTNIAQARISETEFWKINQKAVNLLEKSGVKVLKTYVCPHNASESCECRKPRTLLLEHAISDFNINRKETFMIGDRISDIHAGQKSGLKTILLKTGKHPVDLRLTRPTHFANNLLDAAEYILRA